MLIVFGSNAVAEATVAVLMSWTLPLAVTLAVNVSVKDDPFRQTEAKELDPIASPSLLACARRLACELVLERDRRRELLVAMRPPRLP